MSQADAAIERFRKGERYQPPPVGFLSQGRLLSEELTAFGPALRKESAGVREQIVALLSDAGQRADPLYETGGAVLRVPGIISMLVQDGLSKDDLGREAALTTLQDLVPVTFLKPHEKALTADLDERPGPTAFLVVAKTKPAGAAPVVRKLMGSPRWAKEEKAKVAAAALGNVGFEKEFSEPFVETGDPKEKARLARILGWIGTESALRTLASEFRTDLVIDQVGIARKSVRLDILAAVRYNLPEETVLYENRINNDNGYAQVERFFEQRFGVSWSKPRPPYLKIMGYPIPMPPPAE
jgi:hypothetical protein